MSVQDNRNYNLPVVAERNHRTTRWTSRDTGWLSNLFGTAVGAGILYLPLSAGQVGFIPLLVIALFAGPIVWLAHRNLTRFCLGAQRFDGDITTTMTDHFGGKVGSLLTLAYFLSIYPILLLYAIGLTNVAEQLLFDHLGGISVHRSVISFILLAVLVAFLNKGERFVLSVVEALVLPLVVILVGISLYLIPQWHLDNLFVIPKSTEVVKSFFLIVPILVFSFNHSPVCSAFAQAYRMAHQDVKFCAQKTDRILAVNAGILLVVVMLFVFSCVLSLTPDEIEEARDTNLPVLLMFARREGASVFALMTSIISFLAISSSFFGAYMGSIEGVSGVFSVAAKRFKFIPSHSTLQARIAKVLVFLGSWLAAYLDLSVIHVIEGLLAPCLAVILFFMPVYAYYTIPAMKHYRNKFFDLFTVASGAIVISGFIVSRWL